MTNCKQCNNQTTNNKFCSLACANRYNNRNRKSKYPQDRICDECGGTFSITAHSARNHFCNKSCSAIYYNSKRRLPARECVGCRTQIAGTRTSKYCSVDCRQNDKIVKWLLGELDGNWKYTHADYVRAYVAQRANNSCEICFENRTRTNGQSILQVDHIDGNWRNNFHKNLRLLCPTCHALTDNYGALNMGNGRKWKKEYSQF